MASYDARALGELVKQQVDRDFASKVEPDHQHLLKASLAVIKELGLPDDFFTIGHVMGLLSAHVTPPSREFPKVVYDEDGKELGIAANAEEEGALRGGARHPEAESDESHPKRSRR